MDKFTCRKLLTAQVQTRWILYVTIRPQQQPCPQHPALLPTSNAAMIVDDRSRPLGGACIYKSGQWQAFQGDFEL